VWNRTALRSPAELYNLPYFLGRGEKVRTPHGLTAPDPRKTYGWLLRNIPLPLNASEWCLHGIHDVVLVHCTGRRASS
jgi:hypothetical protein